MTLMLGNEHGRWLVTAFREKESPPRFLMSPAAVVLQKEERVRTLINVIFPLLLCVARGMPARADDVVIELPAAISRRSPPSSEKGS